MTGDERSRARDELALLVADAERRGDGAMLARAAIEFADCPWPVAVVDDPVAADLLERALALIPRGENSLGAMLRARLARETVALPRARRLVLAAESLDLIRESQDALGRAYVLLHHHWATWDPARLDERIAACFEALQAAERASDASLRLQARVALVIALVEAGNLRGADVEFETCEVEARELASAPLLCWIAAYRSMRALGAGRFDEAQAHVAALEEMAYRSEDPYAPYWAIALQFLLLGELGRADEFLGRYGEALERPPASAVSEIGLARAELEVGKHGSARARFDRLAARQFADLPRDLSWLEAISMLGNIAVLLGDTPRAGELYDILLPYAGRNITFGPAVTIGGSASLVLGELATLLGRATEAERHFTVAESMNLEMGLRPWLARAEASHARMLLSLGGDAATRARGFLQKARETATDLGMRALLSEIEKIESKLGNESREIHPADSENVFRKEGEYWTIHYEKHGLKLKHSKGLQDVARLLAHPGKDFHVADLAGAGEPPAMNAQSVTGLGNAGEILDPQARSEYRERLASLEEELEEANRFHDRGRAAKAQEEIDFLTQELSAAFGLCGRARKGADSVERARKAVASRIQDAISRIRREHPALALHFDNTIRTGTFCCYTPDRAVVWRL